MFFLAFFRLSPSRLPESEKKNLLWLFSVSFWRGRLLFHSTFSPSFSLFCIGREHLPQYTFTLVATQIFFWILLSGWIVWNSNYVHVHVHVQWLTVDEYICITYACIELPFSILKYLLLATLSRPERIRPEPHEWREEKDFILVFPPKILRNVYNFDIVLLRLYCVPSIIIWIPTQDFQSYRRIHTFIHPLQRQRCWLWAEWWHGGWGKELMEWNSISFIRALQDGFCRRKKTEAMFGSPCSLSVCLYNCVFVHAAGTNESFPFSQNPEAC